MYIDIFKEKTRKTLFVFYLNDDNKSVSESTEGVFSIRIVLISHFSLYCPAGQSRKVLKEGKFHYFTAVLSIPIHTENLFLSKLFLPIGQ